MDNRVSLEEAAATLKEHYGGTYNAGFEDGKRDFEQVLQERLQVSDGEAKTIVEALVEARTIRWESNAAATPNPEGTMGMIVQEATWYL